MDNVFYIIIEKQLEITITEFLNHKYLLKNTYLFK